MTIEERAREAIQRGRTRLAASAAHLDRSKAALSRTSARNHPQQDEIQRAIADSERQRNRAMAAPAGDPDPDSANERLVGLRQQLADKARKLAAAEDETARLHEDIAAHRPDKTVEARHIAGQARAAAQRAREIADNLSPPEDHHDAAPATGGPAPAGRGDSSRTADDRSRGATTTNPAGSAETEAHPQRSLRRGSQRRAASPSPLAGFRSAHRRGFPDLSGPA